jgi:ribosome-interacting GTPase 1
MSVLAVDPGDADVLGETEFVLERLAAWRLPPPKLLVANKADRPGAEDDFAAIQELYRDRFSCLPMSAISGDGLDAFRSAVFRKLDVVRFYSKPPGKKADLDKPYVLRRGETVQDAASHVHRDFAEHLKYARLFRIGDDHTGLMVERTHVVEDRDILEFHT